jgi:exodeoxyribonuclease V alpha subunit
MVINASDPSAPDPRSDATDTLEGQIERITYSDAANHFMIAKLRVGGRRGLVTVLGHITEPRSGETLRLHGLWQSHPRYGQQFRVQSFEVLLPADVEEMRRYLSSGLIRGIGPRTAERLIQHFKEETLAVIEREPHRLAEVRGIGVQLAERIGSAWQEHHAVRALINFLQENGVQASHAARIFKTYGAEALAVLRETPYRLAEDLPRIGFVIADTLARRSGAAIDDAQRAEACLRHLLELAWEDGHMYIPRQELTDHCGADFELDFRAVEEALAQLEAEHLIAVDKEAPGAPVYLAGLYHAETETALRLRTMAALPPPAADLALEQIPATVFRRLGIALTDEQLAVLEAVRHRRVVIVTGGPGTGKTTLIRAVAALFEALGLKYLLAAPTGRAARRIAEVTDRPAATLHKLLGYNLTEGRFEHDRDNPLDIDAVIVDEASMVDTLLMGHFIQALPITTRLILVGDVFQLPSVGPGTVLADLIAAETFTSFELKEVFRQATQSPIIANAHKIRGGELPETTPVAIGAALTEFTFIEESDQAAIGPAIVKLCAEILPARGIVDSRMEVQVLTPMHKGPAGTLHLNRLLQSALNPGTEGLSGPGGSFRCGDKVMHLRNNYRKDVFNGEIGTICAIDAEQGLLRVAYDGREVNYETSELDELTLAYAISVHKSQGSEYPVIVMPLVTQHYMMLQRNLLYTALTRARRMVILIGSPKALRVAVQTDTPRRRRSLLAHRLNPDIVAS